MREIIYVQAGTAANYVGTHFWNEQDYYATLEANGDEQERIDHAKSFSIREDPNTRSNSLRPRLLLFERKGNLGGLIRAQAPATDQDAGSEPLWGTHIEEHKEEAVSPSKYLTQVENDPVEDIEPPTGIRYWSDFNHTYFSSHSLHVLPDLPDSGRGESILGWAQSKDEFSRIFAEKEIEENDLRYLAEECDNLQGFQMSFDIDHYGGFISSFHDLLQDEYHKADTLNFAFLSMNAHSRTNTPKTAPLLLNDALTLRSLSLLDGRSVPLFQRQHWPQGSWSQHLILDDTLFHTSALYAAHIESITYPLRQLGRQDTIRSMFSSSDANFYELSGILPIWSEREIDVSSILDFTTPDHLEFERRAHSRLFARGVARGCPKGLLEPLKEKLYLSENNLLDYARPYLLPLSHPQFFHLNSTLQNTHAGRIASVPTLSLLSQTSSLASLFDKYAREWQEITKRGSDLADGRYGVDRDELGQVVEDLFNARDAYGYFGQQGQEEEHDLDI